MTLYHTGPVEIREPDLSRGRKNADFGPGFYLSPDLDFSRRWAGPEAVVNEYDLDESGLLIRRLTRNEEWFRCIFCNRRSLDTLSGDVIIGPIANDTLFDTLGMITSGFLPDKDALQLLMIGPEYTQAVIKTEKALRQLRWIRAEKAVRQSGDLRRAEQDAYAAAFAEAVQRLLGGGSDASE